jgi:hypothetical protein
MNYPTLTEVETADKVQLGTWLRFLPTPGWKHAGQGEIIFKARLREESETMDRIAARFLHLGGWNPELSKQVGLEPPSVMTDYEIASAMTVLLLASVREPNAFGLVHQTLRPNDCRKEALRLASLRQSNDYQITLPVAVLESVLALALGLPQPQQTTALPTC